MKSVSWWALTSLACVLAAGLMYLLGRLEGDRLVAAGQGWEMAFYLSPLVFMVIDAMLILGGAIGLVGLAVRPGVRRRMQAGAAMLACVGSFVTLRWW